MTTLRSFRFAGLPCLVASAVILASHPAVPADPPLKPLSSFDAKLKPLLERMTLDEKVGQMTQPDQDFIKDLSDIENYSLGSILSGGSSDPKEGNTVRNWTDLYDRLQQHTAKSRLKIPFSTASTPCMATTTCWAR